MTDLTPEKIAELEALDAKRTRGGWSAHNYSSPTDKRWPGYGYMSFVVGPEAALVSECVHAENAAFIAAAANALPALLADWRRMREALDAVTLLLRRAREAKNGTAKDFDGGDLFGFVIEHHDYLTMHGLLNDPALVGRNER